MDISQIKGLRMQRQALITPLSVDGYDELFRAMSPVHTLYWTEPGAPPVLQRRAAFDDLAYNDARRGERKILKGRYQNGSVGYVDRRDLELYACAYVKPIDAFKFEEMNLLELLHREGAVTIGQIKQVTGMLVKKITPVLHRLQQAFLVFEDQTGTENDRLWYVFESAFPEVDLHKYTRVEAIAKIILRFLPLNGAADAEGIKSFYGFNAKDVKQALDLLSETGAVATVPSEYGLRYCLSGDAALLDSPSSEYTDGVFLLHRSDFWVKSEEHRLKEQYRREGSDVLYYIVIDGEINGAVMGRFKFGPHRLDDVLVNLPEIEKTARREEILEAVYAIFDRGLSPVQRYDGEPLP